MTAESPQLTLMPATAGEVTVMVHLPASVKTGRHTLQIEVRSAPEGVASSVEELTVAVARRTRWDPV